VKAAGRRAVRASAGSAAAGARMPPTAVEKRHAGSGQPSGSALPGAMRVLVTQAPKGPDRGINEIELGGPVAVFHLGGVLGQPLYSDAIPIFKYAGTRTEYRVVGKVGRAMSKESRISIVQAGVSWLVQVAGAAW